MGSGYAAATSLPRYFLLPNERIRFGGGTGRILKAPQC